MTSTLRNAIEDALEHAARSIAPGAGAPVILEKPRLGGHGDFSTNLALLLAKECGAKPRDLAGKIVGRLKGECGFCPGTCERIEIAGPGFINLFIAPAALQGQLAVILGEGGRYGLLAPEQSQNIQLEFVSANPTGPLTVAHGRQAAMGDSLARILARAGHRVTREYYLNDRGKQIQLLGASAFERYKELFGQEAHIPEGGYLGGYIVASGENIKNRDGNRWLDNLNLDEGKIVYFADSTAEDIRKTIVKDLEDFRVHFDHWTSEKEFSKTGKIEECIEFLRGKGVIYEKDGAVWFRTGSLGDDKDRVLVKSDGERTYFAPDIAYHRDK
ncbi:MAG: arginine--tRNA ligase, partial [Candidatus Aureabacteria bacterium]|nr:arginine--tRNA ligase [Candidatus Auribacterota bacterium]